MEADAAPAAAPAGTGRSGGSRSGKAEAAPAAAPAGTSRSGGSRSGGKAAPAEPRADAQEPPAPPSPKKEAGTDQEPNAARVVHEQPLAQLQRLIQMHGTQAYGGASSRYEPPAALQGGRPAQVHPAPPRPLQGAGPLAKANPKGGPAAGGPPGKGAPNRRGTLFFQSQQILSGVFGRRSSRATDAVVSTRDQEKLQLETQTAVRTNGPFVGHLQGHLLPAANFRSLWNIYVTLLILYSVVMVPFGSAFEYVALRPPGLIAWDVLVDFSFLLDITLNFFAPFTDPNTARHQNVFRLDRIARRYASSWFIPDILSSIPADLFASSTSTMRYVWNTFRLLRMLRVARLARLLTSVQKGRIMSTLESRVSLYPGSGRLLGLVFWVGLIAHWFCCLQFYVARYDGFTDPTSWVVVHGLVDAPVADQYLSCLYWVLTTLTTVGYGDYTPGSTREKVTTIIMFLVGATVFAFLIGSVTGLAASMDRASARYRERIDALTAFLSYNRVPAALSRRIKAFFEHFLRGPLAFDEGKLLEDISDSLRTELAMFRHKEMLLRSPLFRRVPGERRFLERVVVALRRATYGPGDQIFHAGERGNEMFFIAYGRVRIARAGDGGGAGQTITTLSDGNFFGEIAVLSNSVRTAHAIALDYCELYALAKDALAAVLDDFPHIAELFAFFAMERMEENAERDRAGIEAARLAALPAGQGDVELVHIDAGAVVLEGGAGAVTERVVRPEEEEEEEAGSDGDHPAELGHSALASRKHTHRTVAVNFDTDTRRTWGRAAGRLSAASALASHRSRAIASHRSRATGDALPEDGGPHGHAPILADTVATALHTFRGPLRRALLRHTESFRGGEAEGAEGEPPGEGHGEASVAAPSAAGSPTGGSPAAPVRPAPARRIPALSLRNRSVASGLGAITVNHNGPQPQQRGPVLGIEAIAQQVAALAAEQRATAAEARNERRAVAEEARNERRVAAEEARAERRAAAEEAREERRQLREALAAVAAILGQMQAAQAAQAAALRPQPQHA